MKASICCHLRPPTWTAQLCGNAPEVASRGARRTRSASSATGSQSSSGEFCQGSECRRSTSLSLNLSRRSASSGKRCCQGGFRCMKGAGRQKDCHSTSSDVRREKRRSVLNAQGFNIKLDRNGDAFVHYRVCPQLGLQSQSTLDAARHPGLVT